MPKLIRKSNPDVSELLRWLELPLETVEPVLEPFRGLFGAVERTDPEKSFSRFVYIPGSRPDRVLLVAHADTVWDPNYYGDMGLSASPLWESSKPADHRLRMDGSRVYAEDALGRGLGADDRAGCAVLWLLRESGHSLLVTDGEEHGQNGANFLAASDANADMREEMRNHRFLVEFDRKNARDYKCYGVGTDEFRSYVEHSTGYSEPDLFSVTDIVPIAESLGLCGVNLSIGFHDEHGADEFIDVEEWLGTLRMARRWLCGDGVMELPQFKLFSASFTW